MIILLLLFTELNYPSFVESTSGIKDITVDTIQHENFISNCESDEFVRVIFAKYHRPGCGQKDTTNNLKQLCNNKQSCSVKANDDFGDPCFGSSKNLTVRYLCIRKFLK